MGIEEGKVELGRARPPAARRALVSGGSRGVGYAIAAALAGAGWRVALVGRQRAGVDAALRAMRARGADVVGVCGDISSLAGARHVYDDALGALGGPPAVLVHAAGIFGPIEPIADVSAEAWSAVLDTNLLGAFYLTRLALAAMLGARWGRVIYVSSKAAVSAPGSLASAYAVSKVALNRLAAELAEEVEGFGVSANSIHPGEVRTAKWEDIQQKTAREPSAHGLRGWAERVERTGGDPPELAASMVLWLIDHPEVSGRFLLPEDWRCLCSVT